MYLAIDPLIPNNSNIYYLWRYLTALGRRPRCKKPVLVRNYRCRYIAPERLFIFVVFIYSSIRSSCKAFLYKGTFFGKTRAFLIAMKEYLVLVAEVNTNCLISFAMCSMVFVVHEVLHFFEWFFRVYMHILKCPSRVQLPFDHGRPQRATRK